MRLNLIIAALTIFFHSSSMASLTNDESHTLAKQCRQVYQWAGDSATFSPAKILSIEDDGALISISITTYRKGTEGGKNGWGEAVEVVKERYFTCLFGGVAKGVYDIQPTVGYEFKQNKTDLWQVRAKITECMKYETGEECETKWGVVADNYYDSEKEESVYSGKWRETGTTYFRSLYYDVNLLYKGKYLRNKSIDKLVRFE